MGYVNLFSNRLIGTVSSLPHLGQNGVYLTDGRLIIWGKSTLLSTVSGQINVFLLKLAGDTPSLFLNHLPKKEGLGNPNI